MHNRFGKSFFTSMHYSLVLVSLSVNGRFGNMEHLGIDSKANTNKYMQLQILLRIQLSHRTIASIFNTSDSTDSSGLLIDSVALCVQMALSQGIIRCADPKRRMMSWWDP
jgi:hypothetical protein